MRALAPLAMGRANKVPGQGFKYVAANPPGIPLQIFKAYKDWWKLTGIIPVRWGTRRARSDEDL